jgi:hypothetical protein
VSVCGNFFPFLTTIEDLLQRARERVPILVSENERFTKLESMVCVLLCSHLNVVVNLRRIHSKNRLALFLFDWKKT